MKTRFIAIESIAVENTLMNTRFSRKNASWPIRKSESVTIFFIILEDLESQSVTILFRIPKILKHAMRADMWMIFTFGKQVHHPHSRVHSRCTTVGMVEMLPDYWSLLFVKIVWLLKYLSWFEQSGTTPLHQKCHNSIFLVNLTCAFFPGVRRNQLWQMW